MYFGITCVIYREVEKVHPRTLRMFWSWEDILEWAGDNDDCFEVKRNDHFQ